MKKVLAVIVSIFWLALIVGIPALVLSGNAGQLIPTQMQEQLTQLVGQDLLAQFNLTNTEPGAVAGETIVAVETVTPPPVLEPTVAPTEPPTPTPIPEADPTAIPQPESASAPAASPPEVSGIAIPAAVRSQTELRAGPGLDFDSVGLVDAGATILLSGQDETGEWFLMENGNWISSEALASKPSVPIVLPVQEVAAEVIPVTPAASAPVEPAAQATAVVVRVNADANLRSGPGGTFDRVGGAGFNTEVTVVGKLATDNWYLLDTGAWIFGELLESAPDVPAVNADGTAVGSTPAASTEPAPAPTTAPGATTASPTANNIANLRAAPNTSAAIIGSTTVGQVLVVVGKNAAGDWLKLESGSWIFAVLVDNVPADLPVASEDAVVSDGETPTAVQPEATTPITATETISTTTPAVEEPVAEPAETTGTTTAAVDANLRGGPGTTFDLVGSITADTVLIIIARNEAGDWLKLENGAWIFGELVSNPPVDLPVATQ